MKSKPASSPAKASSKNHRKPEARVEAAYRFLGNQNVHPDAIAESGFAATARLAVSVTTLLAIQDTTSLSYTHQAAEHLGDMGGPANATTRGFFVHSSLLVDAGTGATVGLIEQDYWT